MYTGDSKFTLRLVDANGFYVDFKSTTQPINKYHAETYCKRNKINILSKRASTVYSITGFKPNDGYLIYWAVSQFPVNLFVK